MKRCLAIILLAAMVLCPMAWAEEEGLDGEFDFGFTDDGYEGDWVEIEDLDIEFCMPMGWSQAEALDGISFAAAAEDGSVRLSVSKAAEDVEDIVAWGEANLDSYELDEANFYDALVTEEENSIVVHFVVSDGMMVSFAFDRAGREALTREFALNIVGSVCVIWDDDEAFPDVVEDGFDFGEAFEEDMG